MTVFSAERAAKAPPLAMEAGPRPNARNKMDGLDLMGKIGDACIAACFFDPQYRSVLDHLSYGNEDNAQTPNRVALPPMTDANIWDFVCEIERVLVPSGYLFLWVDKFSLCAGVHRWLRETGLETVDLLTWDKVHMGLGYRLRHNAEYMLVIQKPPRRAKGTWTRRDIRDVYRESVNQNGIENIHRKPVTLQCRLIEAATGPGEAVLDPAAGTYTVLTACRLTGRTFIGCDLVDRRAVAMPPGQEVLA